MVFASGIPFMTSRFVGQTELMDHVKRKTKQKTPIAFEVLVEKKKKTFPDWQTGLHEVPKTRGRPIGPHF